MMLPDEERALEECRHAFRELGCFDHQWEPFYMGYMAANGYVPALPFPEPEVE